jgi:hypothetical protein
MRIGELTTRTGVSVRSLRYHEEQNLLTSTRGARDRLSARIVDLLSTHDSLDGLIAAAQAHRDTRCRAGRSTRAALPNSDSGTPASLATHAHTACRQCPGHSPDELVLRRLTDPALRRTVHVALPAVPLPAALKLRDLLYDAVD